MSTAQSGIAFSIEQLVSFLGWSDAGNHGLIATVRCDYTNFEEVLEVRRVGEDPDLCRWLIHRAPDGTLFVVGIGADPWEAAAASAIEAQTIIEMADAAERRANAGRTTAICPPVHRAGTPSGLLGPS